MSEEELRREAVRRRLAGESPGEIAEALGRTMRWVRKWVARHDENGDEERWAQDRSRAPHRSPTQLDDQTRELILAVRERLVSNPRAQYGALAIQWELVSERSRRQRARARLSATRRIQPSGEFHSRDPPPVLMGAKESLLGNILSSRAAPT